MYDFSFNPFAFVAAFLAFVLALSIHGAVQAAMCALLGDAMPASKGRLSLLPTRHMTAIGTIVALVTSFSVLAGLGWGRPVEFDARRLRVGPNVGTILIALTGIVVDLILGLLAAAALRLIPGYDQLTTAIFTCNIQGHSTGGALQGCLMDIQPGYVLRIEQFVIAFAITSILLGLLNLIPLYPLDGYHILFGLLPNSSAIRYRNWIPYMEFTLLVIFFVVPYLLRFFMIAFDPAGLLADLARDIVGLVAGPGYRLYALL
jgi:Zn-dependent protease